LAPWWNEFNNDGNTVTVSITPGNDGLHEPSAGANRSARAGSLLPTARINDLKMERIKVIMALAFSTAYMLCPTGGPVLGGLFYRVGRA
jgi:hypothetical protein